MDLNADNGGQRTGGECPIFGVAACHAHNGFLALPCIAVGGNRLWRRHKGALPQALDRTPNECHYEEIVGQQTG